MTYKLYNREGSNTGSVNKTHTHACKKTNKNVEKTRDNIYLSFLQIWHASKRDIIYQNCSRDSELVKCGEISEYFLIFVKKNHENFPHL